MLVPADSLAAVLVLISSKSVLYKRFHILPAVDRGKITTSLRVSFFDSILRGFYSFSGTKFCRKS